MGPAPPRPPPTSSPRDVRAYIRSQNFCYKHAIQGTCAASPCRFQHHPLPAAFYRDTFPRNVYRDQPRRQPRLDGVEGAPRRVLAAMSLDDYNDAVEQGLVLQDGLAGGGEGAAAYDVNAAADESAASVGN